MSGPKRPPGDPDWTAHLPDLLAAADLAAVPPDVFDDPLMLLDHLHGSRLLTTYQADKLRCGQGLALVVGPYRLLGPLARGGMGMVYLATGPEGGAVAVKLLSPSRAAREPQLVARFHREQIVGAQLPAHPHLVRQLDYGIGRGVEFLVLNHLPGRTVRQLLAGGPLTVGAACRVFADAAAGLHAAHAVGIVHRDLKPSNVMVGPTVRGTVIDFGLALLPGDATADRRVVGGPRVTVGTLDYMPPEQAANAATVGPAADLYALGGGLFTALTGRLPFEADGVPAKLAALRTQLPPSVLQYRADVPFPLTELILSLMGKHPGERPATAAVVAAELERWADRPSGDPVPDRRPLTEVVAEAEIAWRNRSSSADRTQTQTVAAAEVVPVVRLARWQLAALVAVAVLLAGLAALVGRTLAGGHPL